MIAPLLVALVLGQNAVRLGPTGISCPAGYAVQVVTGTRDRGRCVALGAGGGGATPAGATGAVQVRGAGSTLAAYAGSTCTSGQYATALSSLGALTCSVPSASVTWDGVTGKPSTFTPSTHTHAGTDVTSTVASATQANHFSGIPTRCAAGQAATGVDSAGNSQDCFTPTGYTPSGTQYGVAYYNTATSLGTTGAPADSASYLKSTVNGAPTWSKVSLSTGVTSTLPQSNGGTGGLSSPTTWGIVYQTDVATFGTSAAGTGTQVLHGSAAGGPSWAAVNLGSDVTGTLPIASGGTNSTATPTAGGVGYGTGSAHAYSAAGTAGYALVSGGSGAPTWETKDRLYRVTGSNYTNATTTPSTITGLSWPLAANQELGFQCVLGVQNSAATSAIRYNVSGPAGATTVALQFNVHTTSATAEVITTAAAFSAAAQSTSVVASVITTLHSDFIRGVILNGATAGTVSIQAAGSAASTSTVYRGSYCEVF